MKNLSDFTQEATQELYEELRAAVAGYLENNASPDQRHEAYREILPHLLNGPGDLISQRTLAINARHRKAAAETAAQVNGRANDYSLKNRAALLKMRRDADNRKGSPAPITTAASSGPRF